MKFDLLRSREKFLILEIMPKGARGWFLSVDDDRNIIFEKYEKNIDLKKLSESITQRAWEGKHLFKSHRRVIAAAHPKIATTIPIPLDLPRERATAKSKITLVELENLTAQSMQKIFNSCRAEAAKRLAIHELDAILVGERAKCFKVDGRDVKSPVGLSGKKISLLLELTFTRRAVFEDLKRFFNAPEDFFFVEAPQTYLVALSRVRKLPLNLIVAGNEETALYILANAEDEYPVLYRETLDWNFGTLFRKITEELAVGEETAMELYRAYRKDEFSNDAKRAFKKMLQPILDNLLSEVEKAKVRGPIYIEADHFMPFDLPYRHGAATFEDHPIGEILARVDVSGRHRGVEIRPVLYFLEAYFDKSNSEINQKLRRRLHWLTD